MPATHTLSQRPYVPSKGKHKLDLGIENLVKEQHLLKLVYLYANQF